MKLLSEALNQPRSLSAAPHIVLMVDQFPRVLGGGERVVLRTADLLTSAGYRVSIITFAILCAPESLQDSSSPIYLLPMTGVFQPSAFRAAWDLGKFLRRERVQVVQTFFESSNLFGGIATKLLSRAKLIWNRRDMGILRDRKHRLGYKLLPGLPDAVIAVSEKVRQHAIHTDGIPPQRVHVIYNGVKRNTIPASTTELKTVQTIVTIGNIRAVKGHDVLVAAASQVVRRFPEAHFILAGDALEPEYFQSLQKDAGELGLGDHIEFPGGVKDTHALLQTGSIFVLPSRSEGFSNAIVEAMMAGLPVVATRVGGNDEAVVQDETGLLVPPEDPIALADAICSLLESPERAKRMGQAGRERALALFTEESVLQQNVALLNRVLGL